MNDRELLAAVAAGDDLALRELFERHAGWLASRLRRSMPADAVEDVLQETFVSAWRGAASYRGDSDVGGWLWGIARRQAATWFRRNGREPPDLVAQSVQDPAAKAIQRVELARAFNALPDDDRRRLARLAFVEGRSIHEIAEELGIPTGTVKSRIHRLRRKLQQTLEGRSDEQS